MKFDRSARCDQGGAPSEGGAALPAAAEVAPSEADARTRDRVCRQVLGRGPVSAAELAEVLGMTPAGIRRHLDQLEADGLVTTWDQAGSPGPRPRGRPARRWVVTPAGHSAMTTAYDDLAGAALRFLESMAGAEAVRSFAESRVAGLEARYAPQVQAAGPDSRSRAEALAQALAADGYAASTRTVQVAGVTLGVQLCQGHCPVQQVAEQFPQLCDAETEAFSRLLGVHVQRLATLAHGYHVCTTHVPDTAPAGSVAVPVEEPTPPASPAQERTSA
ncbi:MAG: helix-turn-helix domain-containing protein [Kineosporiaceae bacterium]